MPNWQVQKSTCSAGKTPKMNCTLMQYLTSRSKMPAPHPCAKRTIIFSVQRSTCSAGNTPKSLYLGANVSRAKSSLHNAKEPFVQIRMSTCSSGKTPTDHRIRRGEDSMRNHRSSSDGRSSVGHRASDEPASSKMEENTTALRNAWNANSFCLFRKN